MDTKTRTTANDLHLSTVCPRFHRAVELIGRRWTGAILQALLSGAVRYSDIASAVPGLSDRLLSERLRELEAEGIVIRSVIPSIPVRVEYHLTDKGYALESVMTAISGWAEAWLPAAGTEESEQSNSVDDRPPGLQDCP